MRSRDEGDGRRGSRGLRVAAAAVGAANGVVALAVVWVLELRARGVGLVGLIPAHLESPVAWVAALLPVLLAALGLALAVAWDARGRGEIDGATRRQLATRITSLEGQRDRAVEANRLKSEYLASASHELRTPLNAIIGYGEMIAEEIAAGRVPDGADAARVVKAARQLLELINDVLDLSKIEAGRMSVLLEPIDVGDLVLEVGDLARPLGARGGTTFELRVDDRAQWVRGDRVRLRQILVNLLGNAFKFAEGGRVILEVVPEEREGLPWVCFRVRDTGPGLTQEQVRGLFRDYHQVSEDRAQRAVGTGLGLAISQRLADLMAGRVEVESEVGRGSTFTLVMPAPAVPPDRLGPRRLARPAPTGTVVWIDDDPRVRGLAAHLEDDGWRVIVARTPEQGISALADHPEIVGVVLDVQLGGGAGWGLLEALGAPPRLRPIVVASVDDDVERAYNLGSSGFVRKPVERGAVGAALRRLVGAEVPSGPARERSSVGD